MFSTINSSAVWSITHRQNEVEVTFKAKDWDGTAIAGGTYVYPVTADEQYAILSAPSKGIVVNQILKDGRGWERLS